MKVIAVAVGGDYADPAVAGSAYTIDGGVHWRPSTRPPAGYRSAVAYAATAGFWITVGTNGTDVSRDDGSTWTALHPAADETAEADKGWNAISLPFVVGAKGASEDYVEAS